MASTEKWSEYRGASEELRPDGKVVWRASITHQVTDAATEADAKAQGPFQLGSDHPVYGGILKVNFIDPQKRGPAGFWDLRYDFSSDTPELSGTPLNTKPRYRWGSISVTEEVDRDFKGRPILNSAGDPPINHPTREFSDLVLTYMRYEPRFDLRRSIVYRNAINEDTFTLTNRDVQAVVFGGECMCTDIAPVGDIEQGQTLVQVAYEFRFRERLATADGEVWASGFDWRFMDQGYRGWYEETTGTGGDATSQQKRDVFIEASGAIAAEPTRLNGKGKPLNDLMKILGGKTPLEFEVPAGASLDTRYVDSDPAAVFLIYQKYARLPFRGLIPFFR